MTDSEVFLELLKMFSDGSCNGSVSSTKMIRDFGDFEIFKELPTKLKFSIIAEVILQEILKRFSAGFKSDFTAGSEEIR